MLGPHGGRWPSTKSDGISIRVECASATGSATALRHCETGSDVIYPIQGRLRGSQTSQMPLVGSYGSEG